MYDVLAKAKLETGKVSGRRGLGRQGEMNRRSTEDSGAATILYDTQQWP